MRPSFVDIYMRLACDLAQRSTCRRTSSAGAKMQVGAVITSLDGRYVFGVGYNGGAAGEPNGCDSDEPGACGCIHAEENAIINCTVPRETPKVFYVTHMPCKMCAKRLVNLGGVRRVWYGEPYRLTEGVELLERQSITVMRYHPPVLRTP